MHLLLIVTASVLAWILMQMETFWRFLSYKNDKILTSAQPWQRGMWFLVSSVFFFSLWICLQETCQKTIAIPPHLTFAVFNRTSPAEIRLVRPVLENSRCADRHTRNQEKTIKATKLEERKRGATVEKLEQNNMHYSLFFFFFLHEQEQNKHAALASGAAARLLIERVLLYNSEQW